MGTLLQAHAPEPLWPSLHCSSPGCIPDQHTQPNLDVLVERILAKARVEKEQCKTFHEIFQCMIDSTNQLCAAQQQYCLHQAETHLA
eukprot:7762179-Ditylum_brightwellii.AAC.1